MSMKRPADIPAAVALLDEALARLSKRTKAHKLLLRARLALQPPLDMSEFNNILKKVYSRDALEAMVDGRHSAMGLLLKAPKKSVR